MPQQPTAFFRSSVYIFALRFFPLAANMAVLIFFSKMLSLEDYGRYQAFWVQGNLLSTVGAVGIPVFIMVYAENALRQLLLVLRTKHYILLACWIFLCGTLFAWLQYRYAGLFPLSTLLFLTVTILSNILEARLIVSRRFGALTLLNLLYAGLFCSIHFMVWKNGFTLQAIVTGLTILALLRLLIYTWLNRRHDRRLGLEPPLPELSAIRSARSLWMHMGIYDLTQILFRWVDKFIISLIFTSELSAIYYNGAMDIPFIPLLIGAVGTASVLQMANTGADKNTTGEKIETVLFSGKILSCVALPLFFFFLFFSYELFDVVLSAKYRPSVPIFLASIWVLPLRSYYYTSVLQTMHQGRIINTGAVFDLILSIVLMSPLYLWLGLPGVALSFVISTWLQSVYYIWHTARLLNVSIPTLLPLKNWALKILIYFALFYSASLVSKECFNNTVILTGMLVFTAITGGLSLWLELRRNRKKSFISHTDQ